MTNGETNRGRIKAAFPGAYAKKGALAYLAGYRRAQADAQPTLDALVAAARRLTQYLYMTQNPGSLPKEYHDLESAIAAARKE